MATDDQDLREALKRVAVALKGSGVPFALMGGYAAWARGGPEPDHDVDFLVAEQDADHVAQYLAGQDFDVVQPSELAAMDEHYCDVSQLLPTLRALREQVDWQCVERETADNDYAAMVLYLLRRIGVVAA